MGGRVYTRLRGLVLRTSAQTTCLPSEKYPVLRTSVPMETSSASSSMSKNKARKPAVPMVMKVAFLRMIGHARHV